MDNLNFRSKVEDMLISEMSSDLTKHDLKLIKAVAFIMHNFIKIISYEVEKLEAEIAALKGVN